MNRYTILCTTSQVKKALELGAPLEGNWIDSRQIHASLRLDNRTFEETYNDANCAIVGDNVYLTPTAEQMLGWLEEQIGIESIDVYRQGYTWTYYICLYIGRLTAQNLQSRKEATIMAIDCA